MAVDIVDLTRFYEAPLGAHVQARLVDEIARIWPHGAGANEAVLAYGYGLPLADSLWPAGSARGATRAAWHRARTPTAPAGALGAAAPR